MTLVQIALVLVAVALVVSPTLRVIGRWLVSWAVASVEAELKKALPAFADQVERIIPDVSPAATDGRSDMHLVLDLAAKLREQGNADAVKLCQALLDQMLQKKA